MTTQINLVCCTDVILQDIATPQARQKHVAVTYAMAIKSEVQGADTPDWKAINAAILKRWKMSGLQRIKRRAHGLLSGKVQP